MLRRMGVEMSAMEDICETGQISGSRENVIGEALTWCWIGFCSGLVTMAWLIAWRTNA
jgi:hypothetical protein